MTWTDGMTREMRDQFPPAGDYVVCLTPDSRDARDPSVLGHKLLKLRDSEEMKKSKYSLAETYDYFWG